ncbi:hypothetical protein PISMIDRAFT_17972 [Pisolithus microcarpus 441]|uniref:Uncharacterized protein n=1 Tax=Pisolithus microcarpus 441 TaxID=765257 RepID=A0A0C9Z0C8_9AGAM|nr:hypothetical protein BKA83DRAFT_17972 [Pisolithus microcarpus]KIK13468.1 hypothetical protein PISMIDRAFT_17972 [Pisolithus microcarpus 441]
MSFSPIGEKRQSLACHYGSSLEMTDKSTVDSRIPRGPLRIEIGGSENVSSVDVEYEVNNFVGRSWGEYGPFSRITAFAAKLTHSVKTGGQDTGLIAYDSDPWARFSKLACQGETGDDMGCLIRGIKREQLKRGQIIAAPGSIFHPSEGQQDQAASGYSATDHTSKKYLFRRVMPARTTRHSRGCGEAYDEWSCMADDPGDATYLNGTASDSTSKDIPPFTIVIKYHPWSNSERYPCFPVSFYA